MSAHAHPGLYVYVCGCGFLFSTYEQFIRSPGRKGVPGLS